MIILFPLAWIVFLFFGGRRRRPRRSWLWRWWYWSASYIYSPRCSVGDDAIRVGEELGRSRLNNVTQKWIRFAQILALLTNTSVGELWCIFFFSKERRFSCELVMEENVFSSKKLSTGILLQVCNNGVTFVLLYFTEMLPPLMMTAAMTRTVTWKK